MRETSRKRRASRCVAILVLAGILGTSTVTHAAPAPPWAASPSDDPDRPDPSWSGRIAGLSHVAAFHAGLYTWAYFAWYRGRAMNGHIVLRREGAFGPGTYAGGADKLGHYYSSYAFARLAADYLAWRGWSRGWASTIGSVLSLTFFTIIEFKDGLHEGYGFSPEDMVANTLGCLTAVLMVLVPEFDQLFDLRLYYVPSKVFSDELLRKQNVDLAEDYTGSTYLLAFKFDGVPWIRRTAWIRPLRYVNLVAGYNARHFLPHPRNPQQPRDREFFVGFSLDLHAILRDSLPNHHANFRLLKAADVIQEYLQITPVQRVVRARRFSPQPH